MTLVESENVICYDVDDTLVMWDWDQSVLVKDLVVVQCPYSPDSYALRPHEPHIKLLKNHKARGKFVIVWSQSGYQWAEAVVKALRLEEYVDLILSKPRSYVDDLPIQEWMKDRIYINSESNWGTSKENT